MNCSDRAEMAGLVPLAIVRRCQVVGLRLVAPRKLFQIFVDQLEVELSSSKLVRSLRVLASISPLALSVCLTSVPAVRTLLHSGATTLQHTF